MEKLPMMAQVDRSVFPRMVLLSQLVLEVMMEMGIAVDIYGFIKLI